MPPIAAGRTQPKPIKLRGSAFRTGTGYSRILIQHGKEADNQSPQSRHPESPVILNVFAEKSENYQYQRRGIDYIQDRRRYCDNLFQTYI